jgi:polyribonucleotide nucleotidyltransferase
MGPIAGARVGYIDGEYVLNPHVDEMPESSLDLVVAGTSDAVLMVESEAKELAEDVMLGAVMFGHKSFQPVIDAIIKLAEKPRQGAARLPAPDHSELLKPKCSPCAKPICARPTRSPTSEPERHRRRQGQGQGALRTGRRRRAAAWTAEVIGAVFKSLRPRSCAATSSRPRAASTAATCRPCARSSRKSAFCRAPTARRCSPAVKPRPRRRHARHRRGRAVCRRLTGTYKATFMLHYNFPPYSVGETGRTGSPGRREIGHGKLAWRAVHPMLPSQKESSPTRCASSPRSPNPTAPLDGTVCGTSLALMDAGVPLKAPVAGIAMGLIKEGDDEFAVLSDILGDEDHLGDMDFKVAGTADGITSLQMDIKITGITEEIMQIALGQAKDGRLHILGEDGQALTESRGELGEFAPRIES